MTAQTITLNPGTGGPQVLTDSLTQVDGAAAPANAQAQYAKMAFGPQNSLTSVSEQEPAPVKLGYKAASFGSQATSSTLGDFVPLASAACLAVEIKNTRPGAVDIEVRRGGTGATVCVPAGGADVFHALTNANQLQIRRYVASATPINVDYEVRS